MHQMMLNEDGAPVCYYVVKVRETCDESATLAMWHGDPCVTTEIERAYRSLDEDEDETT